MDLSLNTQFSVHLDDRNDLATVSDRAGFEQSVVVMVTDYMQASLPGLTGQENIEEKIRLVVSRVARDHDLLDSIGSIDIGRKRGQPDTFEVTVQYISEPGSFEFEVTT